MSGHYRYQLATGVLELRASGAISRLAEDEESVLLEVRGSAPLSLSAELAASEHLTGLGERFVRLDQRGTRPPARIQDVLEAGCEDTYFYLPALYSSRGYAVLADSDAPARWDLGMADRDRWQVRLAAPEVRLWLFRGEPRRLVSLVTARTGRPPIPPTWVLGVWKTMLGGTERVLDQIEACAEAELPVTACWVYDHYDEETNSGCGSAGGYPTGAYPDLAALTAGIHDRGLRALGYLQPCLFAGSAAYARASALGHLVRAPDGSDYRVPFFNPVTHPGVMGRTEPGAACVDFTSPAAAEWYAGLVRTVLAQGWDGWMQDMGEHLPDDAVLADGRRGVQAHNAYAALYHRACHAGWADRDGALGVFARSGALGSVPEVTAMWPGDQHCDWSGTRGLASVLPAGPSAGLAGVAAWGPDISGIAVGAPGGAGDEELWLRWCEYGALTPIMRDHLGFKWQGARPVDSWTSPRTRGAFRDLARLHLALVPYLERLVREAHATGVPPVRALLLEHPEHEVAWTSPDTYQLGTDLLVAPVHHRGARERRVWFPPGEWVGWWDDRRVEGPAWVTVPAPLGRPPLFQRAGSSIPLWDQPSAQLPDAADFADVGTRTR